MTQQSKGVHNVLNRDCETIKHIITECPVHENKRSNVYLWAWNEGHGKPEWEEFERGDLTTKTIRPWFQKA